MPAQSREVSYLNRFDGGLNLTDQTQSLLPNQSPDCLNVDFGIRRGFVSRGGFRHQATDASLNGARFLAVAPGSNSVLLHSTTGDLLDWDAATLTDTGVNVTEFNKRVRMATHNGLAYMANGRFSVDSVANITMNKWDGTTLTPLGTAWDENHVSSSGNNMPKASHIVQWRGYMWVAGTYESSVSYTNRLRFSHLQFPESWSIDDYFDIGDSKGDVEPITALHVFQDKLVIFKKGEVWLLSGNDPDSFVLNPLTSASGTCTCQASAANAGVLYWFSTDGQLMGFNGQGVVPLSEPIQYWSDIGKIQHGGSHRLMWADGRLWLSLEAGPAATEDRLLFIWSPSAKAFTRYSREVSDMIFWRKVGSSADPLFLDLGNTNLFRYDQTYEYDSDNVSANIRIDGYYRTAWVSEGETATKKRWKRPRVTAAATAAATIQLEVFHDMQDLDPARSFQFPIEVEYSAAVWDTMLWDTGSWSTNTEETYAFQRTSSAGSAYAIAFKFSSQNNTGRWWVDSIATPFRRKSVR
tara:strand:+ start:1503 stop:3071 length:1569 start_codon:yes stop_codon:yes gene_type:complete